MVDIFVEVFRILTDHRPSPLSWVLEFRVTWKCPLEYNVCKVEGGQPNSNLDYQ